MKTRALPPTDLANITVLPDEQQLTALRRKKEGGGIFSYDPVRRNQRVIMDAQSATLFGQLPKPSRERVLAELASACKSETEASANVGVANALMNFIEREKIICQYEPLASLRISTDTKVSYASPFVLSVHSARFIMFLDLRRQHGLTHLGMKFVHAINHHLIVDGDPDFEGTGVLIAKFGADDDKSRHVTPHYFTETPTYSYDELNEMVGRTHELWLQVLQERRDEGARSRDFPDSLFG